MNDTTNIYFDRPKMERLKRAYERAVRYRKETFIFEGKEYFTPYARYLLDYLNIELNKRG